MKFFFALIIPSLISFFAMAGEEHGEADVSERFGPGKAIEAFDKEQGFKLSKKAAASLGVEFSSLEGAGPWSVPKNALVQIKQSSGVYRKYDGWISFVLVKVVKDNGSSVVIQSEDLETNDDVATQGVQYLRMTDADLNAGTVDSCTH